MAASAEAPRLPKGDINMRVFNLWQAKPGLSPREMTVEDTSLRLKSAQAALANLHHNGFIKITPEQRTQIRSGSHRFVGSPISDKVRPYAEEGLPPKEIAALTGLDAGQVGHVITGRRSKREGLVRKGTERDRRSKAHLGNVRDFETVKRQIWKDKEPPKREAQLLRLIIKMRERLKEQGIPQMEEARKRRQIRIGFAKLKWKEKGVLELLRGRAELDRELNGSDPKENRKARAITLKIIAQTADRADEGVLKRLEEHIAKLKKQIPPSSTIFHYDVTNGVVSPKEHVVNGEDWRDYSNRLH